MKRCPECRRDYHDDTLSFCLADGTELVYGLSDDEPATAIFHSTDALDEAATGRPVTTNAIRKNALLAGVLGVLLVTALGIGGYWLYGRGGGGANKIESIAVMPFVNESGNPDVEYLSDGITETLIGSLSQLPNLNVKPRSSVFRYKGKEIDPKAIGNELNVQAILNGRVVQRGQDLLLFVELVDVKLEKVIWSQRYERPQTAIVSFQTEITRDVAANLKLQLSGAEELRLTKNSTVNNEAYQLYLKGRYHIQKSMKGETQEGISYLQQAIDLDPSFALAYAGLSDSYRILSLGGELPASEVAVKAKTAASKAVELDEGLAEGHAALGSALFFFDWDWQAAEAQFRRAIELDPKAGDSHQTYAFLLSCIGRHDEAIAEIRLARELEPLNLRTNALEVQYLVHAGRTDEALLQLKNCYEINSTFWLAHLFAASAYIEKGMFAEAAAEARRAQELTDASTHPSAFLAYSLAKGGKSSEAKDVLDKLLKLSGGSYVSPYSIALIYNGMNDTEKSIEWLERGYRERSALMVFLKSEPKWNNLRADPRFESLMERIGFPQ